MRAQLEDDSMKVQLTLSQREYEELKALADAHRTPEHPDGITEEIHYLPKYGELLTSAALEECWAAGYESFEALEAAAAAHPVSAEDTKRMWDSIVSKLRAAGLWVEDRHSEVKGQGEAETP